MCTAGLEGLYHFVGFLEFQETMPKQFQNSMPKVKESMKLNWNFYRDGGV